MYDRKEKMGERVAKKTITAIMATVLIIFMALPIGGMNFAPGTPDPYLGTVHERTTETYSTVGLHSYTAPVSGWYELDVEGAQGGGNGTHGSRVTGRTWLEKGQTVYINVGGEGSVAGIATSSVASKTTTFTSNGTFTPEVTGPHVLEVWGANGGGGQGGAGAYVRGTATLTAGAPVYPRIGGMGGTSEVVPRVHYPISSVLIRGAEGNGDVLGVAKIIAWNMLAFLYNRGAHDHERITPIDFNNLVTQLMAGLTEREIGANGQRRLHTIFRTIVLDAQNKGALNGRSPGDLLNMLYRIGFSRGWGGAASSSDGAHWLCLLEAGVPFFNGKITANDSRKSYHVTCVGVCLAGAVNEPTVRADVLETLFSSREYRAKYVELTDGGSVWLTGVSRAAGHTGTAPGGANGGGTGWSIIPSFSIYNANRAELDGSTAYGGGGATHISHSNGTIDNTTVRNNMLIAAGGGGGQGGNTAGGNGGVTGLHTVSGGQGSSSTAEWAQGYGGGGGGWWGGYHFETPGGGGIGGTNYTTGLTALTQNNTTARPSGTAAGAGAARITSPAVAAGHSGTSGGGANGGGDGTSVSQLDNYNSHGSGHGGGGATHISFARGNITDAEVRNNMIIAAGGGGGIGSAAAGSRGGGGGGMTIGAASAGAAAGAAGTNHTNGLTDAQQMPNSRAGNGRASITTPRYVEFDISVTSRSTGGDALANTRFVITGPGGKNETVTTNADGIATVTLEDWLNGVFTIEEADAGRPLGYAPASPLSFEIDGDYISEINFAFEYEALKVVIERIDEATQAHLSGGTYKITRSDGIEVIAAVGTTCLAGWPDGEYIVTEVTAPDGYPIDKRVNRFVTEGGAVSPETVVFGTSPFEVKVLYISAETGNQLDGAEFRVTQIERSESRPPEQEQPKQEQPEQEQPEEEQSEQEQLEQEQLEPEQTEQEQLEPEPPGQEHDAEFIPFRFTFTAAGGEYILKTVLWPPGVYLVEGISAPYGYSAAKPASQRLVLTSDGTDTSILVFVSSLLEYRVIYKDWDGAVLKEETVKHGNSGTPPADPRRPGHTFGGWTQQPKDVTGDLTVIATYRVDEAPVTESEPSDDGHNVDEPVDEPGDAERTDDEHGDAERTDDEHGDERMTDDYGDRRHSIPENAEPHKGSNENSTDTGTASIDERTLETIPLQSEVTLTRNDIQIGGGGFDFAKRPASDGGSQNAGTWSLISLLLCVTGIVLASITLIRAILYNTRASFETNTKARRETKIEKLQTASAAIIAAVAGFALFILFNDLRLNMALLTPWTIINAITTASVVFLHLWERKKRGTSSPGVSVHFRVNPAKGD